MPPRRKPSAPKRIEQTKHKDKRKNIPTEELREFVRDAEDAPGTLLYPRDPSLDPQLVWKGKDEQDREDLAVPVVPVYIQEKIHPRAIIENVRANVGAHGRAPDGAPPEPEQMALFSDFNGIEFDQLIEFYQHE
jgi:adenine-specific DNA-methyltransferase